MIVVLVVLIILRHRRRKNGSNHRIKQSFDPGHVTLNLHDLPPIANGKISNGNKYNSLATSDLTEPNGTLTKHTNGELYPERFDVIQARKLPELPNTPESGNMDRVSLVAAMETRMAGSAEKCYEICHDQSHAIRDIWKNFTSRRIQVWYSIQFFLRLATVLDFWFSFIEILSG